MELLTVKELNFTYPEQKTPALEGVSFSVPRGAFVTLVGPTGSGKTTLLRMLKRELTPRGDRSGEILLGGKPLETLSPRESALRVGFVCQHPEEQIVTDRVYHELAFGAESLGLPQGEIRRRAAEAAARFGLEELFERDTADLSGGQKQLLNLASVMALQPELLLLDEPTSRLDPVAAAELLSAVRRLNRELAVTVIMTEHRPAEALPLSDRLLVLKQGRLILDGPPRETAARMAERGLMAEALPAPARLWSALGKIGPCPLDVREGRSFVENNYKNEIRRVAADGMPEQTPEKKTAEKKTPEEQAPEKKAPEKKTAEEQAPEETGPRPDPRPEARPGSCSGHRPEACPGSCSGHRPEARPGSCSGHRPDSHPGPAEAPALELSEVFFRFHRRGADVLKDLSLRAYPGEITCILGGNGSGKTTLLRAAAGLLQPCSGSVRVFGKPLRAYGAALYRGCLAMLPQEVQSLFLCNTVAEELKEAGADAAALPFDLTPLYGQHPYDLSGGQQQLLALAKVLAADPKLLLLDEPTKGLDGAAVVAFTELLQKLKARGMAIVIVTHDPELAASCADRAALMFRGSIISEGEPRPFFAGNCFYTTAVCRMTAGFYEDAVTVEDALALCRANGRRGEP